MWQIKKFDTKVGKYFWHPGVSKDTPSLVQMGHEILIEKRYSTVRIVKVRKEKKGEVQEGDHE